MFLNLSKGKEELKALLARNLAKKNPEDNKDEQLEQLQAEVEAMRTRMLGQMALIQGLARGQEELRTIINKLHQDGYNRMKQAVEAGDQVIDQPPRRQKVGVVPQNFLSHFINISHHKALGTQDQARVCSAQDTSLHC